MERMAPTEPAARSTLPAWRRGLAVALGLLVLVGAASRGLADGSILHELLPPDPSEDVSLAATTLDGELPAAVETPSGVVTAPDPRRPPEPEKAYSGGTNEGPESTYTPDRDTRRPDVEHYDDPFTPATVPFKRLRAYDAVTADYTLRVADKSLKAMTVGGSLAQGEEPFYGDLTVDLAADRPVRIPSVGPGARILKAHTTPEGNVSFARDGADNWFARSTTPGRVRLVVQLAIPRATFGSEFADVSWSELARRMPIETPPNRAAFEEVAEAVGISRASQSPREVVAKMVEYFRDFVPSNDPPRSRADIYLDLALSKKGVCRHRAFAFLVTALHIGLPARMVVNEAHAWVEVYDGELWHRIDLGGAATDLEDSTDPSRPPYVPPPDPYAWPAQRDSGQELADREHASNAAQSPGNGAASPAATSPLAPPPPSPSASAAPNADKPASTVVVRSVDKDVRRGFPLHVQGVITADGAPCGRVRVDVVLTSREVPDGRVLGSLSADDAGAFDGAVVVPRDLGLGDYDLVVVSPGDSRCGWGRSE